MTQTVTMTPADIFRYQNDLARTGKCLPLGRMRTVAVGPCESYTPPPGDPIINGYGPQPQRNARGRMLDLSNQWLPIGQAPDKGMIVCLAPMIRKDGYVGLPDLVDPTWRAPEFTAEEAMNPDCDANCRKVWDIDPKTGQRIEHKHVNLRAEKDKPRMIPQRLEDRTNDRLAGSNYLVFQPVLRITYQPESLDGKEHGFQPAEWKIEFRPDTGGVACAFLVDVKNGECHFFGGVPIFGGDTRG